MKNLRNFLLIAAVVMASAGIAKAEGESASKPMKTTTSLKAGLAEYIQNLNLSTFGLTDETVVVEFVINNQGNVGIVSVNGDNCVVKSYVEQMLKDKTIYVTEELSDKVHTLTMRYVQL